MKESVPSCGEKSGFLVGKGPKSELELGINVFKYTRHSHGGQKRHGSYIIARGGNLGDKKHAR